MSARLRGFFRSVSEFLPDHPRHRRGARRTTEGLTMADLLELAEVRLADLLADDDTVLAAVMRRLFDPDNPEPLTVSAFASSL